jgi:hypothetical protein
MRNINKPKSRKNPEARGERNDAKRILISIATRVTDLTSNTTNNEETKRTRLLPVADQVLIWKTYLENLE